MNFTIIASLIIIGLLAGMLSGFLGVGGGVIMVPLML
ncbi:MAG: putative membrane protein YfcA, partial [Ulvibacter sp.]